nr:hypothetical protein [Methylomarinum sp. Ch1-1]MDP4523173.1 hypothetical protein [Methylomarinum sp. Ch1-1]
MNKTKLLNLSGYHSLHYLELRNDGKLHHVIRSLNKDLELVDRLTKETAFKKDEFLLENPFTASLPIEQFSREVGMQLKQVFPIAKVIEIERSLATFDARSVRAIATGKWDLMAMDSQERIEKLSEELESPIQAVREANLIFEQGIVNDDTLPIWAHEFDMSAYRMTRDDLSSRGWGLFCQKHLIEFN